MSSDKGKRELNQAFDGLEQEVPDRVAGAIRWLRSPQSRKFRIPLGILFIAASFLGPFLPVVGLEMLPIGLMLIAQDVPFLRKPVARAMLWCERKYVDLRTRRRVAKALRRGDQTLPA
jgi:hypothetical protein